MLVYRLPRTPSTPRITCGASCAASASPRWWTAWSRCRSTAETASSSSGWQTRSSRPAARPPSGCPRPATAAQERALAARDGRACRRRVSSDHRRRRRAQSGGGDVQRRRTLARLRRELRRVGSRDYFPTARARRGAGRRSSDSPTLSVGGGAMRWATRRHCHVDRTACAWLVAPLRRSGRRVRVRRRPRRGAGRRDAVRHARRRARPPRRTAAASRPSSPATTSTIPRSSDIGRIVHEADIGDDLYDAPEAPGLDAPDPRRLADRTDDDQLLGHDRSRSTTASTSCSGDRHLHEQPRHEL